MKIDVWTVEKTYRSSYRFYVSCPKHGNFYTNDAFCHYCDQDSQIINRAGAIK